jgi:class 3 adenylate cyclase
MAKAPETRYAKTPDGAYLAYQVVGDGPVDLVWQFDFFGNVDAVWEQPETAAWLHGLAAFSRLILHDRRGTGLSSRNVPPPNLETRVDDLRSLLDTIDVGRVVLAGAMEGGAPNALFAAAEPERVRSMVWWGATARSTWAPDYPWGVDAAYERSWQQAIGDHWGTEAFGEAFRQVEGAAGHTIDPASASIIGRMSRHTATPDVALELARIWNETDVRGVLPSVHVPTLVLWLEDASNVEEVAYAASLIPSSELRLLPGSQEGTPEVRSAAMDAIRSFIGIEAPAVGLDTILSTVLFTDIVDSTRIQAIRGDRAWKELVLEHHAVVREALERWRGVENDTAGDGFYATFDGPARAIRCAMEVTERVRPLEIEVRAGVHTGECELIDDKCGGLTVSIGARVASNAGPSDVLVSQTVKDLVAGSGLTFEDAGEHELKGVPDRWRLYRVVG